MINREHPSDLARFRHTDFGYFAGEAVPLREDLAVKLNKSCGDYPVNPYADDRPASIQFKGRVGGRW